MRRFLYWLTNRLPCRIISDDGVPYLERTYLMTLFGLRFYIHRFVGSDPDRGTHCHPWPWAFSLILAGWYVEERRRFKAYRRVRWFNFLTGDTFHRVILPDGSRDVWTLFIHRADVVKTWGFLRARGQLGTIWTPYPHQTGSNKWWLSVPVGRDEPRRMPR